MFKFFEFGTFDLWLVHLVVYRFPSLPSRPEHFTHIIMSSTTPSLLDFLKPRKNEAILKLRNSIVALVVLVILTNLSPLPSVWTSTRLAWGVLTRAKTPDFSYGWWLLCMGGEWLSAIPPSLHQLTRYFRGNCVRSSAFDDDTSCTRSEVPQGI